MPHELDKIISTAVSQPYILVSYHRRGNPRKSQWVISTDQEVRVFETSHRSNWLSDSDKRAWGMHLVNGKRLILGRSARSKPPVVNLWLAKFVRNPGHWHGYPANRKNIQDRPPESVLRAWRRCGHVSKSEMSKIRKGKRCCP